MKKKKISEMKNLGPQSEEDFNAIGIYHADQLNKLTPEKAFMKMLEGRLSLGKSVKCVNAMYLYAIYGAQKNIDWQDIPERKKKEFKAFTKKLRTSKE